MTLSTPVAMPLWAWVLVWLALGSLASSAMRAKRLLRECQVLMEKSIKELKACAVVIDLLTGGKP